MNTAYYKRLSSNISEKALERTAQLYGLNNPVPPSVEAEPNKEKGKWYSAPAAVSGILFLSIPVLIKILAF